MRELWAVRPKKRDGPFSFVPLRPVGGRRRLSGAGDGRAVQRFDPGLRPTAGNGAGPFESIVYTQKWCQARTQAFEKRSPGCSFGHFESLLCKVCLGAYNPPVIQEKDDQ